MSKWLPVIAYTIAGLLFYALLFWAVMLLMPRTAHAHDWYPRACCSNKDCYAIPDEEVTIEAGGYRIKTTGELIPFSQARPTPDAGRGKYHRCSFKGNSKNRTMGLLSGNACFWAPSFGS